MLTVRLSWISGCRPGVEELLLSPPPFWKCGDFLQCGGEEERRGEGPQSNTCSQPASHQSDLFVRTTAGCCQRSQFAVYNWTAAGIIGQPPDCASTPSGSKSLGAWIFLIFVIENSRQTFLWKHRGAGLQSVMTAACYQWGNTELGLPYFSQ